MWTKIKETQYYLLFSKDHGYEICVTDYVSVWTTLYSEKAFLAQLKESNDGLELPDDNEFVQKGVHLLSNIDNLKKFSIEKKENGKSLFITMTISFGFPFYLECKLPKGSEELFFQKVTRSLLKTICDLRESQSELRQLLIKKDSEIEEYKCKGGKIALRHLKTVAFNDEEHMKKYNVFQENFGTSSVSTTLLEEAVEILEKDVLKQDQTEHLVANIKTEPLPVVKTELVPTVKTGPVATVKTEPIATVKTEPVSTIKVEPKTEVFEETDAAVITASVSCKQEIKRETIRTHIPRKKSKFNF